MPPVNIEHSIFLLLKHYREIHLTTSEMDIAAYILIQKHEDPQKPLSIKRIAQDTGQTLRSVQTKLRAVEAKNALEIIPQRRDDGGNGANEYDFSRLFAAIEEVLHASSR